MYVMVVKLHEESMGVGVRGKCVVVLICAFFICMCVMRLPCIICGGM